MTTISKEGSAHDEQMQKEWLAKLDSQIHDLIHEERLFPVILDLTKNGFLEELLVKSYLAKTEEEILDAHRKLVEFVEDSLTRVATRRSF